MRYLYKVCIGNNGRSNKELANGNEGQCERTTFIAKCENVPKQMFAISSIQTKHTNLCQRKVAQGQISGHVTI